MGQPQTEPDERPIRFVLSVGKPHESSEWYIIMGTPFLGIIIIFAIWNCWSSAPGQQRHSKLVNSAVCLVILVYLHTAALFFFCLITGQAFFFFVKVCNWPVETCLFSQPTGISV